MQQWGAIFKDDLQISDVAAGRIASAKGTTLSDL